MIYLNNDDLKTDAQERFIIDSAADFTGSIDSHELKAIAKVKAYLAGRYDVQLIFDTLAPIRDEIIVEILVKIVLYRLFSRNSARKFSAKEGYDEAMQTLKDINSGVIILDLPPAVDDQGNSLVKDAFGNLKNKNYYI